MPIRPENVSRYPADWQQIRERIRERARNRCELCGVENHALGGRLPDGRFMRALPEYDPKPGTFGLCRDPLVQHESEMLRVIRIVCTVAHWYDDRPEACSDENLKFACQRCHLEHDAHLHAQNRAENARKGRAIADLFGAPSPEERDALRARLRLQTPNAPKGPGTIG